jgi:hypothetical protein
MHTYKIEDNLQEPSTNDDTTINLKHSHKRINTIAFSVLPIFNNSFMDSATRGFFCMQYYKGGYIILGVMQLTVNCVF